MTNIETLTTVYMQFIGSELGRIYMSFPWEELLKRFDLKRPLKNTGCVFTLKGMIALMYLKHYTGCCDKELIKQINTNTNYQLFCGLYFEYNESIDDYEIISKIRCRLANNLKGDEVSEILNTYNTLLGY